jgi:hypothetical protein
VDRLLERDNLSGAPRSGAATTPTTTQGEQMETQKLYRGRLIDHQQLVVQNLVASKRFYTAVLAALGVPLGGEGEDYFGPTSYSYPVATAERRSES